MLQIGNTPLIQIDGILAKLECCNCSGSIKDRIAKYIIDESEKLGLLKPGMKIIEATSGNTGIALGTYGRGKGYDVTIVMPENMTEERISTLRAIGVNLILCSKEGSFAEAAQIRDRLANEQGMFNPDQFSNPLNIECHYKITAQEIIDQLPPNSIPAAFVAGVGTGGTLIGVGKRLKELFPKIKIIAVEPEESAVMSGGQAGIHGINGIGDGFIPAIASDGADGLNPLIDEVICVSTAAAIEAGQELAEKYNTCVGISSGANFIAAKMASAKYGLTLTIFADGFSKYKSAGLSESPHACKFMVDRSSMPGLAQIHCKG